jgi:pimeloyl-ACP methyl ester carboxylesterase
VNRLRSLWLQRALVGLPWTLCLAGCGLGTPPNPSFDLTAGEAAAALGTMRQEPRPLERPVVVLGGIYDPGFAASRVSRTLRSVTTDPASIRAVSFFTTPTFDVCRQRVLDAVNEAWPSDDPHWTVEVDVVAVSMGGLVARYAARPLRDGGRSLRIRRLFTISTPHRGAVMADLPTFDGRVLDMRAGSAFLNVLNTLTSERDPEILAYTRLGDAVVGAHRAALPAGGAWWVEPPPLSFAHLAVTRDDRILADIARRLRGEPPFTTEPPASLPSSGTRSVP